MKLALAILAGSSVAAAAPAAKAPTLEKVATFKHQVTGVSVAEDGRIFVSFPRWSEDAPVSVAEVKNGVAVPYPDAEWNSWRNATKDAKSPGDHFVCVQSVVADGH